MSGSLTFLDAFGWKPMADLGDDVCKGMLDISGYLPILGIVSGVIRYSNADDLLKERTSNKDFYKALKLRAVVECCCCGFLLIIVDILVALGRSIHQCIHSSCFCRSYTVGYNHIVSSKR